MGREVRLALLIAAALLAGCSAPSRELPDRLYVRVTPTGPITSWIDGTSERALDVGFMFSAGAVRSPEADACGVPHGGIGELYVRWDPGDEDDRAGDEAPGIHATVTPVALGAAGRGVHVDAVLVQGGAPVRSAHFSLADTKGEWREVPLRDISP